LIYELRLQCVEAKAMQEMISATQMDEAWNEADDDLKVEVLKWAEGKQAQAKKWILELFNNDITSYDSLKDWADETDDWNLFVKRFEGTMFGVKLKKWYKVRYPHFIFEPFIGS
jgi:hypothetical protein